VQRGLTLFVDADDTLWENNVYFEAVVAHYIEIATRYGTTPADARARLLDIERERTRQFGYGIDNFQASLEAACQTLLDGRDWNGDFHAVREMCAGLRSRAVLHLPGVDDTLRALASRHRVILFTKGDLDDQHGKLARSGLRRRFHQIDVVVEKDTSAYLDAIARHGVKPSRAWMVGNSPKSDIIPALNAGLGAVFIEHPATWMLEHAELPPDDSPRFLRLPTFSDLLKHF
jgi:putative hydrolase of the HAD superfamily